MKLGTHVGVSHTDTPAKLQSHPSIVTLSTPHICDVQGH